MTARSMIQISHTVTYQSGLGVSLHGLKRDTVILRNFSRSMKENLLLLSQKSWSYSNSVGSLAVIVHVKLWRPMLLDAHLNFGGLAVVDTRENGAHPKSMQACMRITFSFRQHSCCLATTMAKLRRWVDSWAWLIPQRHPSCVHKSFTASLL